MKVQVLFDSDSLGIGVFRFDVNDLEFSNVDSLIVWELVLLGIRYFYFVVWLVVYYVVEGVLIKGQLFLLVRL